MVENRKLYERLGIQNFAGATTHLGMLESAQRESPKSEFEAAWNKLNRADIRGLLALDYYLMEDQQNAVLHARACLEAADEFLFGKWRKEFKTPEGRIDPRWWKERFTWMEIYEHCLLWGAALRDSGATGEPLGPRSMRSTMRRWIRQTVCAFALCGSSPRFTVFQSARSAN
jgi:hypothetical protein